VVGYDASRRLYTVELDAPARAKSPRGGGEVATLLSAALLGLL
jgi:hypothetical protein